ncbi:MAG: XRE family transcriptional regulator [Acidobacteria bacterium]|nr:XRE family transcriptional regulator [Acidobacteriota bacterium]
MSDLAAECEARRRELIEGFQDREAREGYAEGYLHTWIASQLATVRQQRGLTQKALAGILGTKQPGVARMERDDYGKWNLATLTRVAAALDCRLKVSLETYGTLVREIEEFTSPEYMQRPDFAHDPLLHPEMGRWKGLDGAGPVGYMRRQVRSWVDAGAPVEQMRRWLSGRDLPPVGDEYAPSHWVLAGLAECPAEEERGVRTCFKILLGDLRRLPEAKWGEEDRELLEVMRQRPVPEEYETLLLGVYEAGRERNEFTQPRRVGFQLLMRALMENQTAGACRSVWAECIESDDGTYAGVDTGFLGSVLSPSRPNSLEVVEKSLAVLENRFGSEFKRAYPEFAGAVLNRLHERLQKDTKFVASIYRAASESPVSAATFDAVERFVSRIGYWGSPSALSDSTYYGTKFMEGKASTSR